MYNGVALRGTNMLCRYWKVGHSPVSDNQKGIWKDLRYIL